LIALQAVQYTESATYDRRHGPDEEWHHESLYVTNCTISGEETYCREPLTGHSDFPSSFTSSSERVPGALAASEALANESAAIARSAVKSAVDALTAVLAGLPVPVEVTIR
jgi:hypothetical protein